MNAPAVSNPSTAMQTVASNPVALWTAERVQLAKKTVCPPATTDLEFELFMEQCRRTGLDPFLKECYCIARKINVGSYDDPKYVVKHEFQAAVVGMLKRAEEEFRDFRGVKAAAVHANDVFSIDFVAGSIKHEVKDWAKRGPVICAWAILSRENRDPKMVVLSLESRTSVGPFWKKDPDGQLRKCAEMAVLRESYPARFSGIYSPEESSDDDAVDVTPKAAMNTGATSSKPATPVPARAVVTATNPAPEKAPPPEDLTGPLQASVDATKAKAAAGTAAAIDVTAEVVHDGPVPHDPLTGEERPGETQVALDLVAIGSMKTEEALDKLMMTEMALRYKKDAVPPNPYRQAIIDACKEVKTKLIAAAKAAAATGGVAK